MSELTKKLFLHKATHAVILNEPAGYLDKVKSELPDGVELGMNPAGRADFVQLFVKDSSELKQLLGNAIQSVVHDGLLWIAYPKKSSQLKSDLNRDVLRSLLQAEGYEGVSLVSLDDTWSAMRFRPVKEDS